MDEEPDEDIVERLAGMWPNIKRQFWQPIGARTRERLTGITRIS